MDQLFMYLQQNLFAPCAFVQLGADWRKIILRRHILGFMQQRSLKIDFKMEVRILDESATQPTKEVFVYCYLK